MKPYELVAALVQGTGKSVLQVAREMDKPSFQATLFKFINGDVASPSRATAEKIAAYFKIPVDAVYDRSVARRVAQQRNVLLAPPSTGHESAQVHQVRDSAQGNYSLGVFHRSVEERIARLTGEQRRGLESVVIAYLDAIAPEESAAAKTFGT